MLTIFRKIRHNQISGNRLGTYLVYALGEIILVVLGILIALKINNLNEQSKHERKIIAAFKEIHSELSGDLIEVNELIEYYRNLDSTLNYLLSGQVSRSDYESDSLRSLVYYPMNYHLLAFDQNGYNSLLQLYSDFPEKYLPLISSLKRIYDFIPGEQAYAERLIDQLFEDKSEYLKHNTDWYADFYYNNLMSEDVIEFFLTDSYYQNYLADFHISAMQNLFPRLVQFRFQAAEVYHNISDILAPDFTGPDSSLYSFTPQDYAHLVGNYQDDHDRVTIYSEENNLYYRHGEATPLRLAPFTSRSFIVEDDLSFNSVEFYSDGAVRGFKWTFGRFNGYMHKVEKRL